MIIDRLVSMSDNTDNNKKALLVFKLLIEGPDLPPTRLQLTKDTKWSDT